MMHDVRDGVLFNDTPYGGFVAQVTFSKCILGVGKPFPDFPGARLSEASRLTSLAISGAVNDVVNQIRSDKSPRRR